MSVLHEQAALTSGRVDSERGIIHNVKIVGPTSTNNRTYPADTLLDARPLYENAKVLVDHDEGKGRSYGDLIGRLENVTFRQGSLYGDLLVNPKHALAEQLLYDAEHSPGQVGLSHDATGELGPGNVVRKITAVRSVDLVWNPATVAGLYESTGNSFDFANFSEAIHEEPHDSAPTGQVVTGPEAIRQAREKREQRAERFLERQCANEHPRDRQHRLREAAQSGGFDFDRFVSSIRSY